MVVGPSAPPMIPMEAASGIEKPRRIAPKNVTYTPNWAAAPNRSVLGLAIQGPKSVMAPTPMKMMGGSKSHLAISKW